MDVDVVYARVFGPTFGRGKPQKLHYSADGKHTLCGMDCYPPSRRRQEPWTDVCGRRNNVLAMAEKREERQAARGGVLGKSADAKVKSLRAKYSKSGPRLGFYAQEMLRKLNESHHGVHGFQTGVGPRGYYGSRELEAARELVAAGLATFGDGRQTLDAEARTGG